MLPTMRCYAIFDGFLLEKEDSMMFREKVEGDFEREKRMLIRVCASVIDNDRKIDSCTENWKNQFDLESPTIVSPTMFSSTQFDRL